eukprot:COSAG01_NODE_1536_length_9988_cov_5.096673_8_plen_47_part_01
MSAAAVIVSTVAKALGRGGGRGGALMGGARASGGRQVRQDGVQDAGG